MGDHILVTPRSLSADPNNVAARMLTDSGFTVVMPWTGRQPVERELIDALPGCVGYLAGVERVSRAVLEQAPDLRAISRNGVGIDAIDAQAARDCEVEILTTPGANAEGVAELAIGLMLSLMRFLPFHDRALKAGQWGRRKGIEAEGRTIGLIGCGEIGKRVVRSALGLGMTAVAYDPYRDASYDPGPGFAWANSVEEVLGTADVLTLHCPPGKMPVIDTTSLGLMKDGSILLNTARPSLIDLGAVEAALQKGRLAGFGTDVFPKEPPESHGIYNRDDVIITPHIGGSSVESAERAAVQAADNLIAFLSGEA